MYPQHPIGNEAWEAVNRQGGRREGKAERRPVRGSDPERGWGAGAQQREGKERPLSTHRTQTPLRAPLLRPAWQPAWPDDTPNPGLPSGWPAFRKHLLGV